MYVCMYGQWLMWPIFTIISVKKIYIYIYILVCCTCMHAVLERKKTQTVIFRDLLVFVHRVDENGATSFISQNALEHTLIEVRNPWLWHKKVEPWVWYVPQTLGPELELVFVDPVQEIHVRQVSCEDWCRYKI